MLGPSLAQRLHGSNGFLAVLRTDFEVQTACANPLHDHAHPHHFNVGHLAGRIERMKASDLCLPNESVV
jgi:hypothetical protein